MKIKTLLAFNIFLATALPSLRIATIALFYIAVIAFYAVYIQSIGSDIGIFKGLFYNFLFTPRQ